MILKDASISTLAKTLVTEQFQQVMLMTLQCMRGYASFGVTHGRSGIWAALQQRNLRSLARIDYVFKYSTCNIANTYFIYAAMLLFCKGIQKFMRASPPVKLVT